MIVVSNEQPLHCVTTQYGYKGLNSAPIWYSFPSRFRNAYQAEMEHFLDVVYGKAKSMVHYKDTLAVSKIATACEESVRTGKIVELEWTTDEFPERD